MQTFQVDAKWHGIIFLLAIVRGGGWSNSFVEAKTLEGVVEAQWCEDSKCMHKTISIWKHNQTTIPPLIQG